MSTAIARKTEFADLKNQLEQRSDQFSDALPKHIPVERFMRVVLTAIQFAPELIECTRVSLFNAALKAAQDGLLPDGREAAMVVRKNFRANTKEVSYQPMIAGIRKKARNSGDIASWDAHVVCEHDHFQFQLGDNPQVNHSYDLKQPRGAMVGAYSVAVMKDGSKSYEVMSIADIIKIRDQSDGWKAFSAGKIKSTPWATSPEEMARKTVARRHSKVLPMSSDLDDLIRRDDDLYNFKGEREEQEKLTAPPRTLSARMDALAAPSMASQPSEDTPPHDPETGEIEADASEYPDHADENAAQEDVKNDAPAAPVASGQEQPLGSEGSKLAAYDRGFEARGKGASRRAVPPEFRTPDAQAESESWQNGWDDRDQDMARGA